MLNNRWVGPIFLIGLLILTSLLTVLWPAISAVLIPDFGASTTGPATSSGIEAPSRDLSPEGVVISPEGYLLGEELVKIPFIGDYQRLSEEERTLSSVQVLGILTGVVVGGLVAFSAAIAGLFWFISRFVSSTKTDPEFQAQVTAIQTRIKNEDKERTKAAPATGVPDHSRPVWWAWATGMMSVFLAYFGGLVIGAGISDGASQLFSVLGALLAAVISYVNFRPKTIQEFNREDDSVSGPNWSLIWVLLSGGLMMGLGIGVMYVVISGNNPFPFINWDTNPATPLIDWTYFWDLTEPLRTWT